MPSTIVGPKDRIDPTLGFSFTVQIGDEIQGWFTECSGLTVQREVKEQPEGGVNDFVHQLPGRLKQSNITLKNGLAKIGAEIKGLAIPGLFVRNAP